VFLSKPRNEETAQLPEVSSNYSHLILQ